MCNFNFNRIWQNISRAVGVVSPATLSGTRQRQKSVPHAQPSPALMPTLLWLSYPAGGAWTGPCWAWVGSGSPPCLRSSVQGSGSQLGLLFFGDIIRETEGREGLFNHPVTPADMPQARGHTRTGPRLAGGRTLHLLAMAPFQSGKGMKTPVPPEVPQCARFPACSGVGCFLPHSVFSR